MVSFQCDGCADTVKKPKLDQHRQRCWASFTCLDCSTTFQGQSYKSHTSCVSEAEKYQGALYKGTKKTKGEARPSALAVTESVSATASPTPTTASAPAIHPSRMSQIGSSSSVAPSYPTRGGYAARGRGGGNGGGFRTGGRAFGGTAENTFAPRDGMRSWGSPAASGVSTPVEEKQVEAVISGTSQPAPIVTATSSEKKKTKNRKGDKGGTGTKANSKSANNANPVEPTLSSGEPQQKRRKRVASETPIEVSVSVSTPAEKTLKRLKKNIAKLEKASSGELTLSQWLEAVGKGKREDRGVDLPELLKSVKVVTRDGQFQLGL